MDRGSHVPFAGRIGRVAWHAALIVFRCCFPNVRAAGWIVTDLVAVVLTGVVTGLRLALGSVLG